MSAAVREARRIGVKFFCERGREVPLHDFIPVFHRWIQSGAVPGLLIDVADYSHVPQGPGILLVSHEGIYSLDESDDRRGVAYTARFPRGETLADCLKWSLRAAVSACLALEQEFPGRFSLRGDELSVFLNDRLAAPNTVEAESELRAEIAPVLEWAYEGHECSLPRQRDSRERLSVTVRARTAVLFVDLARRIIDTRGDAAVPGVGEDVTVDQAHAIMSRAGTVYLDVRTEREFQQGHPRGAWNVPIVLFDQAGGPAQQNEGFLDTVKRHVSRETTLLVGCQSGARSQRAADILRHAGYSDVRNVRGGFGGAVGADGRIVAQGWRDAGLPVASGTSGGRSYGSLRNED